MALNNAKKKKIIEKVVKVMGFLDKTKKNSDFYKEKLSKMNLNEMEKWIKHLAKSRDNNLFLEVIPGKNEPLLPDIKKALNYLNIPIEETVYFKDQGNKDNPVKSNTPVMVGYLYIRKMQQFLSKKNDYTLDISKRNQKLNQVTGSSKAASLSDSESMSLLVHGSEAILKEMLGPRADNSLKKMQMYSKIADENSVSLSDLEGDISESQAINTVDTNFLGAGIKTDLLNPTDKINME